MNINISFVSRPTRKPPIDLHLWVQDCERFVSVNERPVGINGPSVEIDVSELDPVLADDACNRLFGFIQTHLVGTKVDRYQNLTSVFCYLIRRWYQSEQFAPEAQMPPPAIPAAFPAPPVAILAPEAQEPTELYLDASSTIVPPLTHDLDRFAYLEID